MIVHIGAEVIVGGLDPAFVSESGERRTFLVSQTIGLDVLGSHFDKAPEAFSPRFEALAW